MPKGIFGYNALGVSLTMACPLKCAHRGGPQTLDRLAA